MNEINEEKNKIIDMIKHGDKSMGIPQRFSGYDKYKVYVGMVVYYFIFRILYFNALLDINSITQ